VAFYADLHIHSKYSRACSKDCDLENLTWWACRKGISLVGTGDFTHPAWYDHLRQTLVPAEPGLYRLKPDLERTIARTLPPACQGEVRFMLSVEISTIYKRGDRTRKIHHLVYLPDLDAVARFNAQLSRIGNLGADGRPILGLDSRDLLEITLEASPDGYLIPAHVWTPWFGTLGSKSGFDTVADCYADLADHIFAIETGLSSDPLMNWRVSELDRYRLVSSSDAHSPPALGREATVFECAMDYYAVREALRTGQGFGGTVEFFPEEGKYHLDGHRACEVRLEPAQTRRHNGRCPVCGKPLTVGVLHRVESLADQPEGRIPDGAAPFRNLVPLPEILGEIHQVGPKSKKVYGKINDLVSTLGPELSVLTEVPIDEISRVGGSLLGEAVDRLRRGQVIREAGYDGEYGVIRLFQPEELAEKTDPGVSTLFDLEPPAAASRPARSRSRATTATEGASKPSTANTPAATDVLFPATASLPDTLVEENASPHTSDDLSKPRRDVMATRAAVARHRAALESRANAPHEPMLSGMEEVGTGLLDRLDSMQRVAASVPDGPLLIVAGPGTGKTRTLTHRIAYLVADLGVPPEQCLAITFTRRAAEEMQERLTALLPEVADRILVTTFHGLGLRLLREHPERVGLTPAFRIADAQERLDIMTEVAGTPREARRLLAELPKVRRTLLAQEWDDPLPTELKGLTDVVEQYAAALRARDLVDLDELITLPIGILDADPVLTDMYHARWPWVFVDEYQDVDEAQYRLLRLLCPPDGNLCAIGDPDQAIYGFRGADVRFFLRFASDYPEARTVRLTRNYRSTAPILAAATQAIAPSTLVRGRILEPTRRDPDAPLVGRYEAATEAEEAEFVARTIDQLVGGSSFHAFDSGRVDSRSSGDANIGFSDIAVLYRTDAQARAIVDALSRAGVPVQKRSHDRLMDRPGVAALSHQLRFTSEGTVVERVRQAARQLSEHPAGESPVEPSDLAMAVDVLLPLATECGEDLERFLTELATGAEMDTWDPRADRVTLLTLHAAKGLEFPVVFLVGCEDGLLPLRLPGRELTEEELAEERRLFFVGLTRAEDRLYLSSARRRTRHGTLRETRPSPFLDAVDASLVERLNTGPVRRAPRDRQLRLL